MDIVVQVSFLTLCPDREEFKCCSSSGEFSDLHMDIFVSVDAVCCLGVSPFDSSV